MNNTPIVNPESHYCVNVAVPFIEHLLEEMSSRFSEVTWGSYFFLNSICCGET